MAISSEGVQVELEENSTFKEAHKNYAKLLVDVAKHFARKPITTKKQKEGGGVEIT